MAAKKKTAAPKPASVKLPRALTDARPAEDGKAHKQPPTRIFTDWNPRRLRQLERSGVYVSGMFLLADLCDQILADDRVKKAFGVVCGGLLKLDLEFEASGDGRRKNKALKALEAGEDWWSAFGEVELEQFFTCGLLAGIAFAELVWFVDKQTGRWIPRLVPWELQHFRFDWGSQQWFVRTADAGEIPLAPGEWVVFTPFGKHMPWTRGLWRGLSRLWLAKMYGLGDWGRYNEKGSLLVATPKDVQNADKTKGLASTKDQRKELAETLSELGSDGVIVLPNGFTVELLEIAATGGSFKSAIEFSNTSIDIAIQGQNLTSEVLSGSFAAAVVHQNTESDVIARIGSRGAETLHDQALTYWAQFNFGDPLLAPWPCWDTDPPEDQSAKSTVLGNVAAAVKTLDDAGYMLEPKYLEDEYGIKLQAKPEPTTTPTEPAVPGTGGAPAQGPKPPAGTQGQGSGGAGPG